MTDHGYVPTSSIFSYVGCLLPPHLFIPSLMLLINLSVGPPFSRVSLTSIVMFVFTLLLLPNLSGFPCYTTWHISLTMQCLRLNFSLLNSYLLSMSLCVTLMIRLNVLIYVVPFYNVDAARYEASSQPPVNTLPRSACFQGFTSPHDVAVSRDGKNIYVGEIEPHNVWKFAIGRQ